MSRSKELSLLTRPFVLILAPELPMTHVFRCLIIGSRIDRYGSGDITANWIYIDYFPIHDIPCKFQMTPKPPDIIKRYRTGFHSFPTWFLFIQSKQITFINHNFISIKGPCHSIYSNITPNKEMEPFWSIVVFLLWCNVYIRVM